jgi:hypothetical protein
MAGHRPDRCVFAVGALVGFIIGGIVTAVPANREIDELRKKLGQTPG